MNKHLIALGMIVLLIAVGLSGCTLQSDESGETTNGGVIEIVSHSIDETYTYYARTVKGTVKNIGSSNIDEVVITAHFYDSDNEKIFTKSMTVRYLANGETDSFSIRYSSSDPYYDQYDHYDITTNPE